VPILQNTFLSQDQSLAARSHRVRLVWMTGSAVLILIVLAMAVRGGVFFMFDYNRGTEAKSYPA
jgi:hypothetical protein